MKKFTVLLTGALLMTSFLTACSSDTKEKSGSQVADTNTKEETNNKKTVNSSVDPKEVKDGKLTEPGQWTTEEDGTKVTLIKISEPNKTFDLGKIKYTIDSIKLIERSNVQQNYKEMLKENLDKDIEDKLNVIQISYTVENISKKDIMFHAIDTVTTNTKLQILESSNLASSNADISTYIGQVKVEGISILPYFEDSFDNLDTINILTGTVWDNNEPIEYHKPKKLQITL